MNEQEIKNEDGEIIFYCKDCEEIVKTNRVGKKYVYTCAKCNTKNVAFGTKKSIYGFFRLDEKGDGEKAEKQLDDGKSANSEEAAEMRKKGIVG